MLTLTLLGAKILAGRDDFARHNRIDRWGGGTHLVSEALWRYDPTTGQLIAPD